MAGYDVEDLTIEEPDIEDIIRRIYRDGAITGNTPWTKRASR